MKQADTHDLNQAIRENAEPFVIILAAFAAGFFTHAFVFCGG